MNDLEKYQPQAESVIRVVPAILANRGLDPAAIRDYILTQSPAGLAWLLAVIDDKRIERLESYAAPQVLHQLSTALRGRPVIISNSTGLRYGVLLSARPSLPAHVDYPGWRAGLVQVGVNSYGQPVTTSWAALGHVLVAGQSGAGKSQFLRLLAAQALAEGYSLALCDPDGRTFPALAGSPALLAPIGATFEGCALVIDAVWAEIARRRALLEAAPGNLPDIEAYNAQGVGDPVARLLVIFDEFNGAIMATGGPRGSLAQEMTRLAWQARKFGVTLILGGQDFTRETAGPVSDQMTTRVCFGVARPSTSRVVLGRPGAERIRQPGRALSVPWGLVQIYLVELQAPPDSDGLSLAEHELIQVLAAEHDGKLTESALTALGYSQGKARALRRDWLARGLAVIDPGQGNAAILADRALRALRGLRGPGDFVLESA